MITRVSTITELKQIFGEVLMNKTNKVTKISDESIVNGISYGVAKIAQKALKDIALVETHIFPDGAFGIHLDLVANKYGISDRFTTSKSRTFVRVVGVVGTFYQAGLQVFIGGGVSFDLIEDVTIGINGYAYALVTSQTSGLSTNVSALSIHTVNPAPLGHQYCVNEYQAEGGRNEGPVGPARNAERGAGTSGAALGTGTGGAAEAGTGGRRGGAGARAGEAAGFVRLMSDEAGGRRERRSKA